MIAARQAAPAAGEAPLLQPRQPSPSPAGMSALVPAAAPQLAASVRHSSAPAPWLARAPSAMLRLAASRATSVGVRRPSLASSMSSAGRGRVEGAAGWVSKGGRRENRRCRRSPSRARNPARMHANPSAHTHQARAAVQQSQEVGGRHGLLGRRGREGLEAGGAGAGGGGGGALGALGGARHQLLVAVAGFAPAGLAVAAALLGRGASAGGRRRRGGATLARRRAAAGGLLALLLLVRGLLQLLLRQEGEAGRRV